MFLLNRLFCLSNNSSQKDVSILDMPDLVMRKILKECDFYSILILRKVCRGFRDFIDSAKPESTLECITLYVCQNGIEMELEVLKDGEKKLYNVVYFKHFNGCIIQFEIDKKKKQIMFGNDGFRTLFFNDLKAILESRGSILKRLELRVNDNFLSDPYFTCWDEFKMMMTFWKDENDFEGNLIFVLKSIKNYLKSRVQPLKVGFIYMKIEKQEDLMQWLPYFDPKSLSIVKVHNSSEIHDVCFQMDQIFELDALKNIDMLSLFFFTVREPIVKFSNIPSVDLNCASVTKEELLDLKEALFSSPTFVYFRVGLPSSQHFTVDELTSIFGPVTSPCEWCFEIPESDKVHKIYWSYSDIKFTREKG